MRCGYDFYVCGIYGVFVGKIRGFMKKYYIGGLLTLVTIAFATVTLAVNKDVIGYRRYIYIPPTKAGSIVFVAFAIYIAVLSVGALVYAIYRHFHKDE